MPDYQEEIPTIAELVRLYESVGWSAYTADPEGLGRAVAGSSFVLTAREDDHLVGLARVISDDHTIMYLQDILVRPDRQGEGIGRGLADRCLERFAHCRQKVLMTDDEHRQHAFYRALGFEDVADTAQLHAFVRFD